MFSIGSLVLVSSDNSDDYLAIICFVEDLIYGGLGEDMKIHYFHHSSILEVL